MVLIYLIQIYVLHIGLWLDEEAAAENVLESGDSDYVVDIECEFQRVII